MSHSHFTAHLFVLLTENRKLFIVQNDAPIIYRFNFIFLLYRNEKKKPIMKSVDYRYHFDKTKNKRELNTKSSNYKRIDKRIVDDDGGIPKKKTFLFIY